MILCQKISKPQLISGYHAEGVPSGRFEAKGAIHSVLVEKKRPQKMIAQTLLRQNLYVSVMSFKCFPSKIT